MLFICRVNSDSRIERACTYGVQICDQRGWSRIVSEVRACVDSSMSTLNRKALQLLFQVELVFPPTFAASSSEADLVVSAYQSLQQARTESGKLRCGFVRAVIAYSRRFRSIKESAKALSEVSTVSQRAWSKALRAFVYANAVLPGDEMELFLNDTKFFSFARGGGKKSHYELLLVPVTVLNAPCLLTL